MEAIHDKIDAKEDKLYGNLKKLKTRHAESLSGEDDGQADS
jgi:hypothetical protein